MDSKHFPSHSTTDNLPSSLSNPGERPPLAAPPQTSTGDTPGVTTSSTNTGPAHMPTGIVSTESGETTCISTSHSDASTQSTLTTEPPTFEYSYKSESLSSVSASTSASPPLCITSSSTENLTKAQSSDSFLNVDNSVQKQTKTLARSIQTNTDLSGGSSMNSVASQTGLCEGSSTNSVASQTVASPSDIDILAKAIETEQASPSFAGPQKSPSIIQEKGLSKEKNDGEASPQRGVKRPSEVLEAESTPPTPSPQKNKKRCFICNCKLELAQRTIGKCRCGRIFCSLHRLPELHNCEFNHKEDGRREAREKMVVPTRHLGKSFRRDDML